MLRLFLFRGGFTLREANLYSRRQPGKETCMSEFDARPWSYESVQELISYAREGVPDTVIAMKMKRSLSDIHGKLSELGLSAKTGE
jgi:hypothetical protein